MKKFLVFILIILILGGVGFFFGWAQLPVPIGSYGVVRSKTHGVDPVIITEGETRWIWYKLIPANAEINVFTIKPITRTFRLTGSLPSGNIYADIAGIRTDFSWEFIGDFSFSVKPESLPALSERENIITQADFNNLCDDYARRIESIIQKRLYSLLEDENIIETIHPTSTVPEISDEIQAAFPELEKITFNITAVHYPDIKLYTTAKELYEIYINHQKIYLEENIIRGAEFRIGARLRLDEFEKVGNILSRYPILLDFLSVEKDLAYIMFLQD